MIHVTPSSSLATFLILALANPLFAAGATAAEKSEQISNTVSAVKCLGDLHDFAAQMKKDGYWLNYAASTPGLDGYGGGLGYPSGGYDLGYYPPDVGSNYFNARPGYEVRMLLYTVDILARHGEQQLCEDVLTAARNHYLQYISYMEDVGMQMANVPGWQRREIASAQPVTALTTPFRSDQLLGTAVRNPTNDALGSVDDLVTDQKTGNIAYLVIARGGVFGIGEKLIPVPWEAFKATANATLFVLDANSSELDSAPQSSNEELMKPGRTREAVNKYWKGLHPNSSHD
jgi:sporulation protein YlmC with PRC-barrel domain